MNSIATWLASIAGPLAWRVLGAIGLGVVVYQGVDAAVTAGLGQARTLWGSFGGTAADLVALSGINTALGIIAGGITARVSLMLMKRFVVK